MVGRPGGDLLSHALRRSTIGAEGFHDRVRDGIGCRPLAITTKSSNNRRAGRCRDKSHADGSGRTTVGVALGSGSKLRRVRRRPDRAASGLGSVRETDERSSRSSD